MKPNYNKLYAIWFFLKQYPAIYISLFLITIAYSVLESINISIFLPLFQSITGGEQSTGTLFIVLERVITFLPFNDRFVNVSVLAITILVIKEGLGFIRQAVSAYGMAKAVCDSKEKVFNKYMKSDYQFILENKQGWLIYNIISAPGKLGNCLQYIPDMVASVLMTLTIGILLMSISFYVTAFLIVVGFAFNVFTQLLANQISYHIGTERVIVSTKANVTANEFIDGIKHIKVFGSFEQWLNNFTSYVRRFKTLVIKDAVWIAIPERIMQLLPASILVGIAIVFKYYKYHGSTSNEVLLSNLPLIGVYGYAFYRLIPFLTSFGRLRMQIMGTLPDVEAIYSVLNKKTNSIKDGDRLLNSFNKEIRVENVSFNYKDTEGTLRDINFSIEKGKTTAIVGPSGSGKSTIVNLLLRLFEPNKGRIVIDGVDIKEIKYSSLIKTIGLVSQETFIFNASIKENILFGLNGIFSDKLIEASRLANAHEFIISFPDGYDTVVGDKGLKLSGGQRQRIAIARAILRNPKILILDEATSSLDYHSENLVQQAINKASKNRTVIVIAHRLSTVINADKIIVLDHGRIVEEGRHTELIGRNGIYNSLYKSQMVS